MSLKIYRFSEDGFAPKLQSHHHGFRKSFIEDDDFFAEELASCRGNEYVENILRQQRQKMQEFFAGGRIADIEYGIWVFTSKHFRRRSLNHLKEIPQMWEADIDEDALAYDVNLERRGTVADIPAADVFGCFLPESSCKLIRNAKKIEHPYQGRSYADFYKRR